MSSAYEKMQNPPAVFYRVQLLQYKEVIRRRVHSFLFRIPVTEKFNAQLEHFNSSSEMLTPATRSHQQAPLTGTSVPTWIIPEYDGEYDVQVHQDRALHPVCLAVLNGVVDHDDWHTVRQP